ncbi:ribosome biogenesis protein SLX9-domain-containing protein [Dactylonectria estremocensis]|uniref:Ribosome biogenesis protein SLX9 n=1 Tax=Dactylonectria estremocensis TaxID=1079267 RepID=A0A9P9JAG8_9HYPO|nr:ribosome biogenesis protein SLX9-domain-containing protein [Dactylonectria estremocensis]
MWVPPRFTLRHYNTTMAPLPPSLKKPSARTLRQQRITGQIHPLLPAKTFRPGAAVSDDFLSSKRDKRLIKHSSFVSKISSAGISKAKRRRPSKKLKTSLDGLADALPELAEGEGQAELAGKIKHKSLRSRKGALKRKEMVVRGEMDRFGVSMAKLTATPGAQQTQAPAGLKRDVHDDDNEQQDKTPDTTPAPAPATANRWAALRGYISATMEQNPAFADQN